MKKVALFISLVVLLVVAVGCSAPAQTVIVTATPTPPLPTVPPTPTETPAPPATPWRPVAPDTPCQPSATRRCSVLFVLPRYGYAHWASRIPDDFEEAGYTVVVASRAPSVVSPCGAGSTDIEVDLPLNEVNVEAYDAIVYVGGSGCQSQWDDEEAHRIARDAVEHELVLAAIGCASTILAHAGVLEGREVTVCETDAAVKGGLDYNVVLEDLGAIVIGRSIVRDGLIITAQPRSLLFVPGVLETIAEQEP